MASMEHQQLWRHQNIISPGFLSFFGNLRQYYKKQFEHCSLTYDAAFDLGMAALGKKRYTPVVNRMSNVGTYGAHFGTEFFKSLKLDQIKFEEVW